MAKGRRFVSVQFQLEAELGHGQTVFVTGNAPALGDNDPNNGVPLFTSPSDYPSWTSDLVSLAANKELVYKYAVFEGGKFTHWEPISSPRCVKLKQPRILSDEYGVELEPVPERERLRAASEVDGLGGGGSISAFAFDEDANSSSAVVINREDESAVASAVGAAPIDIKQFTPHWTAKMPSPLTALMGEASRSSAGSFTRWKDSAAGAGKKGWLHKRGRSTTAATQLLNPDEVAISSHDGVVVVAYFLPVIVTRIPPREGAHVNAPPEWDITWDTENILSLRTRLRVTWVGTVRLPPGTVLTEAEEESLSRALKKVDCVPVYVNLADHDKFYRTFCKGTLWPVFHHMLDVYGPLPTRFWDQKSQEAVWHAYTTINIRFRDKVVEVYNEGDLIWIHGFHLLILPSFISKTMPTARTALFLHTPFPSSEIFRTLSVREDILRGMLNADHIGFHLFEYARHFLTCVRRILGLTYDMEGGQLAVHYNGRTVAVSCMHVGVDVTSLRASLSEPRAMSEIDTLKAKYKGRKVILGIDRLERIRGLPLKLLAYEKFLRDYPAWRGKVVLVQMGITANERGDDYKFTKTDVDALVKRINETYKDLEEPPVVFEEVDESRLRLERRLPLLTVADVFFVTSPRDGLNRMPLEFVTAQCRKMQEHSEGQGNKSDDALPGVLLLSEFVSCTRVLLGALYCNPWRIAEVADKINRVLEMPKEEVLARHTRDAHFVNTHTVLQWAYQVLLDLKRVRKDIDRTAYSGVGLGLQFRMLGMESGFNPLKIDDVARAYRATRNRVIILDYGGTLAADNEKTENVQYYAVSNKLAQRKGPGKYIMDLLRDLCKDVNNSVFVVTGREKASLENNFSGVPGLGFGAEHGFYYRLPHTVKGPGQSQWETLLPAFDSSWMEVARTIMDVYVKRTHGTYIEEKESALLWQYRDADPEFGHMQSKELEDHLNGVLKGYAVEILRGENNPMQGGYIEVRPENVSKGALLEHVLEHMMEHGKVVDFILAIGDDPSDEDMFTTAEDYAAKYPTGVTVFSCTVGKKPSHARSYLNDVDEVHKLLHGIGHASKATYSTRPSSRGFQSSVDLRSHQDSPSSPRSVASSESLTSYGRGPDIRKNLSLNDIRMPSEPPELTSPTSSAMTWQTYVDTIREGNEDDGIFF